MAIGCPSCDKLPSVDARAGAPCAACGTPLVAAGASVDLGSGLDLPELVGLDERDGAPPRAPPPPPRAAIDSNDDYLRPGEIMTAPATEEDPPLELDPEWTAARQVKQAQAVPEPRPGRSIAGVIIAVLLILAVTAAVVAITMGLV